jgi:DNA-binding NarL/FixJ family response regulator
VSTNATRVVPADDEVLMREVLMREGLAGLVRELRPDLLIVDIRMPPTHTTEGPEAAEAIREEFPDSRRSLRATCKWSVPTPD